MLGHKYLHLSLLSFLLHLGYKSLVFPDAAGIIFGARDDGVTLVVERTREDFVFVTLAWVGSEALDLVARLGAPQAACLVTRSGDDLVALWVELDFTDFILVALEDSRASAGKDIVNTRHSVGTRRRQLVTCLIETGIQYLIGVPSEFFDAGACTYVP